MTEMFDINDQVEIDNIETVRQTKNVIPVTSDVLMTISKVVGDTAKDKLSKTLNISFKLINGIQVPVLDKEGLTTPETEIKWKGSLATSFPQRVTYWVSPDKVQAKVNAAKKQTTKDWWNNRQYLVEFKQLLVACGIDPKLNEFKSEGRLQVDALIDALKDRNVIANITQREEEAFDKSTGEYKGLGTYLNEVKNVRKAA